MHHNLLTALHRLSRECTTRFLEIVFFECIFLQIYLDLLTFQKCDFRKVVSKIIESQKCVCVFEREFPSAASQELCVFRSETDFVYEAIFVEYGRCSCPRIHNRFQWLYKSMLWKLPELSSNMVGWCLFTNTGAKASSCYEFRGWDLTKINNVVIDDCTLQWRTVTTAKKNFKIRMKSWIRYKIPSGGGEITSNRNWSGLSNSHCFKWQGCAAGIQGDPSSKKRNFYTESLSW